jgi:hypothetical protein
VNGAAALEWRLSGAMATEPMSGVALDTADGLNYHVRLTGTAPPAPRASAIAV